MTPSDPARVYTDESGKRWLLDEHGQRVLDERDQPVPAMYSPIISKPGEFIIHDDTQGHCSFCGRLTCGGECFR